MLRSTFRSLTAFRRLRGSSDCFLPRSASATPKQMDSVNMSNINTHMITYKSPYVLSCRHKSVFVSKYNQSLNVTVEDIINQVKWNLESSPNYRTTNNHVILEECPFCSKPTKGKAENTFKLYIQLGGGAYFCHRCGQGGSWFDFKAKISKDQQVVKSANQTIYNPKLHSSQPLPMPSSRLQALYNSQLLDQPDNAVLQYLTETRGLTTKTLRKYGIGRAKYSFNNDGVWEPVECVTFPWIMKASEVSFQEELRGVKNPVEDPDAFVTRRIKVRALENKAWQRLDPAGGGWGLFGYHTLDGADKSQPIVLTEGEYDAMAVWQATGIPAVSLPNGCRSLPVEVLPLLEDYEKIYLWMDNDGPGQEGARVFSQKIGLGRCFMVQPTLENTGCLDFTEIPKDANDALLQGHDLKRIIMESKPVPHEQILSFSDLQDSVLHEILHPEKYEGTKLPSLPKFSSVVKGLRRGELTVITGPTGSGKTTFLGQMSLDLAEQGINVLWGSFEVRNTRLIHKLLQQFAREPLPKGEPKSADKLRDIAKRFGELPLHFLKFHGASELEDVLDAMEYAVYVHDCEHIVLDNLQFMISRQNLAMRSGSSNFDKFDAQDIAIEKFRKFATERNVHLTLVVHPRKEDESARLGISSIYGSAKATQEADNVLILQKDNLKKYLDVRKNRFSGELGATEIFFDRATNRYTEAPTNQKVTPNITRNPPTTTRPIEDHWDNFFSGQVTE